MYQLNYYPGSEKAADERIGLIDCEALALAQPCENLAEG